MLPLFGDRFASERAQSAGLLMALQDPARERDYLQSALDAPAEVYGLGSSLLLESVMFDGGDRAFKLVESGQTSAWVIINTAWLPAMSWLREDPRYFRLMQARGRVEYWDSHGYPRGCEPIDAAEGRHLSCPERS